MPDRLNENLLNDKDFVRKALKASYKRDGYFLHGSEIYRIVIHSIKNEKTGKRIRFTEGKWECPNGLVERIAMNMTTTFSKRAELSTGRLRIGGLGFFDRRSALLNVACLEAFKQIVSFRVPVNEGDTSGDKPAEKNYVIKFTIKNFTAAYRDKHVNSPGDILCSPFLAELRNAKKEKRRSFKKPGSYYFNLHVLSNLRRALQAVKDQEGYFVDDEGQVLHIAIKKLSHEKKNRNRKCVRIEYTPGEKSFNEQLDIVVRNAEGTVSGLDHHDSKIRTGLPGLPRIELALFGVDLNEFMVYWYEHKHGRTEPKFCSYRMDVQLRNFAQKYIEDHPDETHDRAFFTRCFETGKVVHASLVGAANFELEDFTTSVSTGSDAPVADENTPLLGAVSY